MTDIMKLADDYANEPIDMYANDPRKYRDMYRADLQSAIEALQSKLGDAIQSSAHWQHQFTEAQAENERLKVESTNKNDWLVEQRKWEAHANALQAKLDAMGKGEPVAHRAWFDADNGARWLFTLWPEEEKLDVEWEPLFAAPKALAPSREVIGRYMADKGFYLSKEALDGLMLKLEGIGGTP